MRQEIEVFDGELFVDNFLHPPKVPGFYLWEGEITYVSLDVEGYEDEFESKWHGTCRPATPEEIDRIRG